MKNSLITILLFPLLTFSQSKDSLKLLTDKQEKEAREIVKIWVEEIFKAESTSKLMQISDVPFAFDRKKILETSEELQNIYEKIFENKVKREIPKYEIQILELKREILDRFIPLNYIKIEVLTGEGGDRERLIICILIRNNTLKIVGFSD